MSLTRPRPRRTHRLALAAALGLLAVPATAGADQITSVAIVNGDAVVDRAIVLEVQGSVDGDGDIDVDVNPAGVPCASTQDLNRPNRVDYDSTSVRKGPLAPARLSNLGLATPGSYTACVYLTRGYPTVETGPSVLPITVRNPNVSLTMSLLTAASPGAQVPLASTTYAEVSRELTVDLNPEGVACGLNHTVNPGSNKIYRASVLGGPTTTVTNVSMPDTAGRYHLCGYVARSSDDATPLLVVDSGAFLVGTPPPPPPPPPAPKKSCTVGPRAVKVRGTLGVRCANVTGSIQIRTNRRGHERSVSRRLVGGVAKVKVRTLRLRRGLTRVTVLQDGKKLGGRTVRRR